jgi:hypothetical protein
LSGRNHDYSMLKQELPPDLAWFRDLEVWVDLGYQGIQSDYEGDMIEIPHKKPRKSKTNPHPELTAAQRAEHKAVSQIRPSQAFRKPAVARPPSRQTPETPS